MISDYNFYKKIPELKISQYLYFDNTPDNVSCENKT